MAKYIIKHNLTDIGQFRFGSETVNVEYLKRKFLRGDIECLFFRLADHLCVDEVEYKSHRDYEPEGDMLIAKMKIGKCFLEVEKIEE